jgi:cytochrome c556
MRYSLFASLLAVLVFAKLIMAAEPTDVVPAALHAVLKKNVGYARNLLDQKDFKSVAQSAGNMHLVAELLKARSDDVAWQATTANVVAATNRLQSAARDEDAAKCQAALEAIEKATVATAGLQPNGKPQPLERAPAIRSVMLTLDAMQGDAKVAVLTGNVPAARSQAHVLAELGKLVSSSRKTDQWSSLAGDFVSAATAAADSTESDSKIVRQQFRAVAERCEACHEKNRTP